MTPSRYIRISRVASFFYLSAISLLVALLLAIAASVSSSWMSEFLVERGILGRLVWSTMILCGPFFILAILIGGLGKCPNCSARFVPLNEIPRPRTEAIFKDARRSFRTALGYECRCEACNQDALRLLRASSD